MSGLLQESVAIFTDVEMHVCTEKAAVKRYSLVCILFLVIFFCTSVTYPHKGRPDLGYADIETYYSIATTHDAGKFYNLTGEYALHQLERWPAHIALGGVAGFFNADIWDIYRLAVVLCIITATVAIGSFKCAENNRIAYLAFAIFNPYSFRLYYAFPGMISDCLLYTAIVVFSLGIHSKSIALISVSTVVAIAARQTGVLLIPALMVLACYKKISWRNSLLVAMAGAVVFATIKMVTLKLFRPVPDTMLASYTLGVLQWLAGSPSWSESSDFLAKLLFFGMTLSPIFLIKKNLEGTLVFLACYAILISQPIMAGPLVTGGNIQRLSAYGIPLLGLFLIRDDIKTENLFVFIVFSILVSLHHHYSIMSLAADGKIIFLVGVSLCAVLSVLYFAWHAVKSPSLKRAA